jgi:hypothetical protein
MKKQARGRERRRGETTETICGDDKSILVRMEGGNVAGEDG